MTAHDTLIGVFASALCIPESPEIEQAEYRAIPQWDSVAHMRLVAAIETAFDIMLDTEDVIGMSSFAQAKNILTKHGVHIA